MRVTVVRLCIFAALGAGCAVALWSARRLTAGDEAAGRYLTGRILLDRAPRANVRMKLTIFKQDGPTDATGGSRFKVIGTPLETVTDDQGSYRIGPVPIGAHYQFELTDPEGLVASGWKHQSPYLPELKPGSGDLELPVAQLLANGQVLRGMVIDPKGNPVSGVTVSARLKNGDSISVTTNGPRPWTETDADGQFELRHLPELPIELFAYKVNRQDRHIRFPAKAYPQVNQSDIRIVLDPKLTEEIEDLDAPRRQK